MKNTIKSFRSRRGEGYVDVTITVLVSLLVILIGINTFSLMIEKQNLDYFTHELMRVAETEGRISWEVEQRKTELMQITGLDPGVSWSTEYFNPVDKTVQLQTPITLTLELKTELKGVGGLLSVPVVLKSRVSGSSQKYWR